MLSNDEHGFIKMGHKKISIEYFHCMLYSIVPEPIINFTTIVHRSDLISLWKYSDEYEPFYGYASHMIIKRYQQENENVTNNLFVSEIEIENDLNGYQLQLNATKAAIIFIKYESIQFAEFENVQNAVWNMYKQFTIENTTKIFSQSFVAKFEVEKFQFSENAHSIQTMIETCEEIARNKMKLNDCIKHINEHFNDEVHRKCRLYKKMYAVLNEYVAMELKLRLAIEKKFDQLERIDNKIMAAINYFAQIEKQFIIDVDHGFELIAKR